MKHGILVAALLVAAVGANSAAKAEGDAEKGKKVFAKCAVCHSTQAGQNRIGPSLAGVCGRAAASDASFTYSAALKDSKLTWDDATLDKWLTKPNALVHGTKMSFPGLPKPEDRADVVAYLKTLK